MSELCPFKVHQFPLQTINGKIANLNNKRLVPVATANLTMEN